MKNTSSRALALLASITCALAISGCEVSEQEEWRARSLGKTLPMEDIFKEVPAELNDCKASFLELKNHTYFHVVRCPNSSTSSQWQSGKVTMKSLVVDGVVYSQDLQQTEPHDPPEPAKAPDRLTINGVIYLRNK